MLLIYQTIKIRCPEGTNLAEQTKIGERKIETVNGRFTEPIFACRAVGGTPFSILEEVRAPIDLMPGDEISVDAATGYVVTVKRGEEQIWPPAEQEEPEPQPARRGKGA